MLCVIDFDSLVEDAFYRIVTKRNILKSNASLFDPLELVPPVILISKVLFQNFCKYKVYWYIPVAESVKEQCIKHLNDLKAIKYVAIERNLLC